jgi:hypothetical protein
MTFLEGGTDSTDPQNMEAWQNTTMKEWGVQDVRSWFESFNNLPSGPLSLRLEEHKFLDEHHINGKNLLAWMKRSKSQHLQSWFSLLNQDWKAWGFDEYRKSFMFRLVLARREAEEQLNELEQLRDDNLDVGGELSPQVSPELDRSGLSHIILRSLIFPTSEFGVERDQWVLQEVTIELEPVAELTAMPNLKKKIGELVERASREDRGDEEMPEEDRAWILKRLTQLVFAGDFMLTEAQKEDLMRYSKVLQNYRYSIRRNTYEKKRIPVSERLSREQVLCGADQVVFLHYEGMLLWYFLKGAWSRYSLQTRVSF